MMSLLQMTKRGVMTMAAHLKVETKCISSKISNMQQTTIGWTDSVNLACITKWNCSLSERLIKHVVRES